MMSKRWKIRNFGQLRAELPSLGAMSSARRHSLELGPRVAGMSGLLWLMDIRIEVLVKQSMSFK